MPPTQIPERGITIPLPLTAQEGWVLLTLLGLALGSLLIWRILPTPGPADTAEPGWFANLRAALGLSEWPRAAAGIGFVFWLILFLVLFGGLTIAVIEVIANLFGPAGRDALTTRLPLLTVATLTATLGATIALPFTLIKRLHSARQTDATEEGLITDRINTAVLGLGAE
ncbi:MAG: hypothetical protein WBC68_15620, partial [Albidovulum sp.]